jgi:uncharacterized protein (DUF1778 family)
VLYGGCPYGIKGQAMTAETNTRLDVRLSYQHKELIAKAALLRGQTMTDFIVQTVAQEAQRVLTEHQVFELDGEQSRVFVAALLDPSAPNAALRAAAQRYRERVEQ